MPKKLNIAMFMYAEASRAGGVQEATYYITRELERRGNSVSIFGPKGKEYLPYRDYRSTCHAIPIYMPHGNSSNCTIPLATKPATSSIINKGDFDICHIQDAYIPFVAYDIVRNVRIPKVTTFNSAWNKDSNIAFVSSFLPLFHEMFQKHLDGAVFVSKLSQRRWHGLVGSKIPQRVIYYGIDEPFVPIDSKRHKSPVRLLFVARIVPRKGLMYLLEAIFALRKRINTPFVLDVLGEGFERSRAEYYVKNHNLSEIVSFHGEIVGSQKVSFFRESDIFCAPYADEAFALTVYEALGCALTIVGFHNDVFEETLAGYVAPELIVKHKDTAALSAALASAITDASLREAVRKWCINERGKHTWENAAIQTEQFYHSIIANYSARGGGL